ncbi:MAG: TRAP transporter substrate-binding protein, partial [Aquisalimonadaceae bacterium]
MKTKLLSSLLLSALIALPVAGAQADDSYPLRMGNITSNDAQEAMGQKFIDLIRENSDGKIDGRLYSSASLGSNDEVMRGLQLGSIQANINPTGYLTQFVPQAGVLALPWIFPGDDAGEMIENITRVMRGEAAQEIKKLAAERGFHIVSFFGIGPNQIFLNPDVTGIDDLDGKRIRTIAGKEHTQTVNDWGARAIHMSLPEIYTSVQQGVLDGFDLPADVTLRVKYHEHARNVLMTNHVGLVQY